MPIPQDWIIFLWRSLIDFQLKKYPKISCGAGILPANNTRTGKMPIPQDWIIFLWCSLRDFQEINYPNKRTTEAQRTQRENFCVSFGTFF